MKYLLVPILLISSWSINVQAEIRGNQLNVDVFVEITQDLNSGIYSYDYSFTNKSDSIQTVGIIFIPVGTNSEIVDMVVPRYWSTDTATNDDIQLEFSKLAMFTAPSFCTQEVEGTCLSMESLGIKPGATLGGFIVKSYRSASTTTLYIEGFVDPTQVEGLPEFEHEEPPGDEFSGTLPRRALAVQALAPVADEYDGNRRPAVDGFLAFRNLLEGTNFVKAPFELIYDYAINGETGVNHASLEVTLNHNDITQQFEFFDENGKKGSRATIYPDHFALVAGRNILVTSIEGQVPDSTRIAKDTDRITLVLEP